MTDYWNGFVGGMGIMAGVALIYWKFKYGRKAKGEPNE